MKGNEYGNTTIHRLRSHLLFLLMCIGGILSCCELKAQYFQIGIDARGHFNSTGLDMVRTAAGNYIVGAIVTDTLKINGTYITDISEAGTNGLVMFELSPQLEINWVKTYNTNWVFLFQDLCIAANGDLLLALAFDRLVHEGDTFQADIEPYSLLKGWIHFDPDGDILNILNVQYHEYSYAQSPSFLNDSTVIFLATNGTWYSSNYYPFYLNNENLPSSWAAGHHLIVKYNLNTTTYEYVQFEWVGPDVEQHMLFDLEVSPDGFLYVSGEYKGDLFIDGQIVASTNDGAQMHGFIMKMTQDYELIWIREYKGSPGAYAPDFSNLSIDHDGNIVGISYTAGGEFHFMQNFDYLDNDEMNDIIIVKISSSGDFLWAKPVIGTDDDEFFEWRFNDKRIAVDEQNRLYLTFSSGGTVTSGDFTEAIDAVNGHSRSTYVLLDQYGNTTAMKHIQSESSNRPLKILPYGPQSIMTVLRFTGEFDLPPIDSNLPDEDLMPYYTTFMVMLNNDDLPGRVDGTVKWDTSGECSDGTALENVCVQANPGQYWCLTDSLGDFQLMLPNGSFNVAPVLNYDTGNVYVECPESEVNVVIDTLLTEIDSVFFFTAGELCSDLSLNLVAWDHVWCLDNEFFLHCANNGPLQVDNAQVILNIPTEIEITSCSHDYTMMEDGAFLIEVGNLEAFGSVTISFQDEIACEDPDLISSILCINALLLPEDDCIESTPWDGSELVVTGNCNPQGYTQFIIQNVGLAMTDSVDFLIYLGGDAIQSGQILLGEDESISVVGPLTDNTVSFLVDQAPSFPGTPVAYLILDDCTESVLGEGVEIPEINSSDNNFSAKCLEVVASYDPNDKQASPVGTGPEHHISPDQEITYLIRFQNVGNMAARDIFIVDTISDFLDVSTFQWLGSEHACETNVRNLDGKNILTFYFDDIFLPDSSIGNIESQGYLSYSIRPLQGLLNGTVITNSASIFFDYNPAIHTNSVWHTVSDLPGFSSEIHFDELPGFWNLNFGSVSAFPNPFSSEVNLYFPSFKPDNICESIRITDMSGRLVYRSEPNVNEPIIVNLGFLSSGPYILRIKTTLEMTDQIIVKN